MGAFTKGQKLDTKRLKRDQVPAPELGEGGHVIVRALSGLEVQRHLADAGEGKPPASDNLILSLCVVDAQGEPVFTDEADVRDNFDVAAETRLNAIDKILRISGIHKDRGKN